MTVQCDECGEEAKHLWHGGEFLCDRCAARDVAMELRAKRLRHAAPAIAGILIVITIIGWWVL